MIHLLASVRVYLATAPCDMRRSFDGLHALVVTVMQLDACAGHLFVFANKRRDRVKILMGIATASRCGPNGWRKARMPCHFPNRKKYAGRSLPRSWVRC